MNNSSGANFSQGSNKGTLVANVSTHESLFLAPSLPCDFGHNISIHCLYKCDFFTMVLINQQMSCKHCVLGTIHCHFSESPKCDKDEKIRNRKHANGNI